MLWGRKANFGRVNTKALFDAVDLDRNGSIDFKEWITFWETVKKAGHTEKEIFKEVTYITSKINILKR